MAKQVLVDGVWFVRETCCQCKVGFFLTLEIYTVADQKKEKGSFYCPNGHGQHYLTGESETDKLRRERDRLAQQIARVEDEKRDSEAELDRAKRREKNLKRKLAAGNCPCCKRSFANMSEHIRKQHPEFVADNVISIEKKA